MTPHLDDRPHPTRTLLILGVSALAFALAQTMLIPALTHLAASLNVSPDDVAWALTSYFVAAAVFTPVMGRLGDMYGKRRLLVISIVVFGLGSAVSALGTTLGVVVGGRVLQGVGGGIFPLCFGIIRDEFPAPRVSSSIGLISATVGIGGGLGLVLGGLVTDHLSYHWIFWTGAIMAALAAVLTQWLVPESPNRSPSRVDVRGAVVLGVGLVAPLIAISQANSWGWADPRTLGLLAFGLVVLALWVVIERRTDQPLADIPLLVRPPVLMTNVTTLLVGFGMFGSFILTPQLLQAPESTGYGFGLTATEAGLVMLPGALGMLFLGPVSGVLGSRYGNKLPLALGAAVTAIGLVALALDHGTVGAVAVTMLVISAGIGLAYAAMPNLIVVAVPQGQTGEATGFNALVRSVGSSLGSQLSATVVAGSIAVGSLLPTDQGYRNAYLLSAAVAGAAAAVATLIPVHDRGVHVSVAEEVGAASPLGDPMVPDD